MGAITFAIMGKGKTASVAFSKLVEDAQYEYGHRGYTGTIAEKSSFVIFNSPKGMSARTFMNKIMSYDPSNKKKVRTTRPEVKRAWEIYDDKWGPAVCIPKSKTIFYFIGYAPE